MKLLVDMNLSPRWVAYRRPGAYALTRFAAATESMTSYRNTPLGVESKSSTCQIPEEGGKFGTLHAFAPIHDQ
jgi:hypothetical protein